MFLQHLYIVFMLLILMFANKRMGLSLLNPSLFLISIWFFFYIVHWLIGDGMFISFKSTTVALWLLFSFNFGELYCISETKGSISSIRIIKGDPETKKKMRKFIFVFSLVAFVFAILYSRIIIQSIGGISAYLIADVRAETFDISVPLWIRIPLLFSYSLVLISAIYYYNYGELKLMVLSSLPILVSGLAQNGRAGTLMVVVIFFMAIILRAVIKEKKDKNKTLIRYGLYIAIVGAFVFIGGALFRYRNMETEGGSFFLDSFKAYLLGGISAFDTYLHNPDTPGLGFGRYSFSSLYALLGIAKNEVGVYTNYLVFNVDGDTTNIFTAFRQMIDDFGLLGASIYMFLLGVLGGKEWLRAKHGDNFSISFMLLFYMFLFHTPLLAVTVHNSILFSFIVPSILLRPYSQRISLCKK